MKVPGVIWLGRDAQPGDRGQVGKETDSRMNIDGAGRSPPVIRAGRPEAENGDELTLIGEAVLARSVGPADLVDPP